MSLKEQPVICLLFSAALIFAVSLSGCCRTVVTIGSPYERYDHNRTRQIEAAYPEGPVKIATRRIVDEVYIPFGSRFFPAAQYKSGAPGTDRLPAANIVPIFTGISLPLSDESVAGGTSDRKDLIDFLAKGPRAMDGVEPGDTAGDNRAAEITYKQVLDLFESRKRLEDDREKIIEGLSPLKVDMADGIIDSRYSMSSFKEVIAFRYENFWFILYKLPDCDYYSRLVVSPEKPTGQDFPGKRL